MWGLMGKDAVLSHLAIHPDDDDVGSQFVKQSRTWFDSMWNTVARGLSE